MTWRSRAVLLLLAGLLLLAAAPALARIVMGGGVTEMSASGPPLTIEETDGTPSGPVTILKVSPGTLTLVGEEATLVTGGGLNVSGTPSVGQLAAFINPTTVEGVSTITLNYAAAAVNTAGTVTTSTEHVTTGPGGVTRTLPAAASGTSTRRFTVLKVDSDAGALTIAPAGADTINGSATPLSTTTQWAGFELQEVSATGWVAQPISSTAATGATFPLLGTSTANPCFAVGPAGATNPALQVDCSVASAVGGLSIRGNATPNGVTITTTGSGASEALTISSKNNAAASFGGGGASGTTLLTVGGANRLFISNAVMQFTPGARTSGTAAAFTFTGAADTSLSTGAEAKGFVIDLAQTKQHAGSTTIALQRHMHFIPGTDTCATATCTIAEDYLLSLGGPISGGTNSIVTASGAFHIGTRALANVTNGYGMVIDAPTGATTLNAAAYFRSGPVLVEDLKTSAAGAGKKVVCVDEATGRLYTSATALDCS